MRLGIALLAVLLLLVVQASPSRAGLAARSGRTPTVAAPGDAPPEIELEGARSPLPPERCLVSFRTPDDRVPDRHASATARPPLPPAYHPRRFRPRPRAVESDGVH
jgi:hypothetical protein